MKRILMALAFSLTSLICSAQEGFIQEAVEQKIDALLTRMTLEQKIGQMIQGEIKSVTPEDIRQYGLGSVLNGGGSFPNGSRYSTVANWLELADIYYLASTDKRAGSAGIPLIWGTDAVHGHNNVIGATLFPHNIGLGAANDPDLMYRIGQATAREVAATGIDWIFAPTVAIAKDDRWGRTYESYADRPDIVADYAEQITSGIQSVGLLATAKHFIGDGGTHRGIDQGNTVMPLDELLALHGEGYVRAIDAGVYTVMASFNSWNGEKVHGNKQLLTDVLKKQLGFQGFVVSDWNGIGQVAGCTNDSCPQAINAGIDMVMAPDDWKPLFHNMVREVRTGVIEESRIDDAVRRILRVKFLSGIMDAPKPSLRPTAAKHRSVGTKAHRELAREAVRKSLVMLKNNDNLLPLKPNQHVLVTGSAADDIGRQSGGWTISWQGTGNENSDFPGATSIYEGIRERITSAGGSVTYSQELIFSDKPDVAVVVFGELPYAEGKGDLLALTLDATHQKDYDSIKQLQSRGIPVVSIFLTGRPLWINRELNASDAFVVAWLPGTEGAGVADVLFYDDEGEVRYPFEGRLSFDWPAQDLNPMDYHQPVSENLFAHGYGLDVDSGPSNIPVLDERRVGFDESKDLIVFKRGTEAPWKTYLGDEFNWSTEVVDNSATSAGNIVQIVTKDFQVQEDARQITWSDDRGKPGQIYWQAEEPIDLSPLENAEGSLSVVVRVDRPLKGTAEIRIDCGWPCEGSVKIGEVLSHLPHNEWTRLSIPLSCFIEDGLDVEKVNTPFLLSVNGTLQITVAEVSILENPPEESVIRCEGGNSFVELTDE